MNTLAIRLGMVLLATGPLAAAAFAADVDVEVQLLSQVNVLGPQVLLGEVAHVRGNELEAVRRLVNLPLGRAPRAQGEVRLSRDALVRWTRSRLGGLASHVDWTGAEEVVIGNPRREAQAVPPSRNEPDAAPMVTRGEWVTLKARNGGIELESPAEVLQDGQLGQQVRIRWAGASGAVTARVVARGRVEMMP